MVVIKLKRIGKKKRPFYNFVVMEKLSYIKGKYIDKVGYFDPIKKVTLLKLGKVNDWLSKGAKLTKRLKVLLKMYIKHNESKKN